MVDLDTAELFYSSSLLLVEVHICVEFKQMVARKLPQFTQLSANLVFNVNDNLSIGPHDR